MSKDRRPKTKDRPKVSLCRKVSLVHAFLLLLHPQPQVDHYFHRRRQQLMIHKSIRVLPFGSEQPILSTMNFYTFAVAALTLLSAESNAHKVHRYQCLPISFSLDSSPNS